MASGCHANGTGHVQMPAAIACVDIRALSPLSNAFLRQGEIQPHDLPCQPFRSSVGPSLSMCGPCSMLHPTPSLCQNSRGSIIQPLELSLKSFRTVGLATAGERCSSTLATVHSPPPARADRRASDARMLLYEGIISTGSLIRGASVPRLAGSPLSGRTCPQSSATTAPGNRLQHAPKWPAP